MSQVFPSRLLPPGNLQTPGLVSARACARSIRIPLVLPLKVGGNKENNPKFKDFPAAPEKVTVKTLLIFEAEVEGVKLNVNFFQLEVTPVTVAEAKVVPLVDFKATVRGPVKEEDLA